MFHRKRNQVHLLLVYISYKDEIRNYLRGVEQDETQEFRLPAEEPGSKVGKTPVTIQRKGNKKSNTWT